ncbi:MAG: G2/mitotic-specific cyclin [Claussenomyces sp. TS43310]|nr:MAG: G2/mitotic-specific cyclin [Claussenomyces sp. TS43310]
MPPARPARQRTVTNENDENVGTTRLTRAKAAALNVDDGADVVAKKPMQSKKSGLNAQPQLRRRAALGDVSNVTKGEAVEGKKALGGGKIGLISKASQPTGVQKNTLTRTGGSRPALGSKDLNKNANLKRTNPGSGLLPPKKRSSDPSSRVKDNTPDEGEPQRKEKRVKREAPVEEVQPVPVVEDKLPVAELARNLDDEDIDDPLMVAEYVHEIFDYLKELEVATAPNADYMEMQDDLEWKMRGILVDWLIEVHTRFHLLPETLFLAVNIIDRFLSNKVVHLDRLQLVGVTAMFVASKYEEVLSPHVANFRHVADDGFSEADILSAERYVLATLNYDLSYPNPMNFLRRISKADDYDIQTRTLGKYLMEISLLDYRFMSYLPSHVAAAAMFLARMILERGQWDATLVQYAGYTEEEIEPVYRLMVDYLARPVVHEAFFKKYASKRFLKASIITRQWAKKHAEALGVDISIPLDETCR